MRLWSSRGTPTGSTVPVSHRLPSSVSPLCLSLRVFSPTLLRLARGFPALIDALPANSRVESEEEEEMAPGPQMIIPKKQTESSNVLFVCMCTPRLRFQFLPRFLAFQNVTAATTLSRCSVLPYAPLIIFAARSTGCISLLYTLFPWFLAFGLRSLVSGPPLPLPVQAYSPVLSKD